MYIYIKTKATEPQIITTNWEWAVSQRSADVFICDAEH
jgi:hypothetical protein